MFKEFFLNSLPNSVEKGNLGVPLLPGQGCSFHSFRTNTYKLSFMESPSGIKVSTLHALIWCIYFDILNKGVYMSNYFCK